MSDEDIRVIVGVDFGTTFSGFAYAHLLSPESVFTNTAWPLEKGTESGRFKANTVLHYDADAPKVLRWGRGAVAKPAKNYATCNFRVAELFKLHLADSSKKPEMPKGISAEQAIIDYLKALNTLIGKTVTKTWTNLLYPQNVRFVFTVPAAYNDRQIGKMQQLVFNAGFLESRHAPNLEIITEPEAASLYCLSKSKQYNLDADDLYLIVDCGGGTVDLTVRKIVNHSKIGEFTERTGDFAGGSFVDQEFVSFLTKKFGEEVMKTLRTDYCHQFQHLIDTFCTEVKSTFDGRQDEFRGGQIELDRTCPVLKKLLKDSDVGKELEDDNWLLELDFLTIKGFFDPAINKIVRLIHEQLAGIAPDKVSVIFLVGGFAESAYLHKRVKDEFSSRVALIASPTEPEAAIIRGAVHYGIDMNSVETRILSHTYGTNIHRPEKSSDPPECERFFGLVEVFCEFVKRGTCVTINEPFTKTFYPLIPWQEGMNFKVFATTAKDVKYIHEPGLQEIGELKIKFPENDRGEDRPVQFTLSFEQTMIRGTAVNPRTKEKYSATFGYADYSIP